MLPPMPAAGFTIAVLPDTQQYAAKNPAGFEAVTQWVADNREEQRIVFCSHVGDVVRHFDRTEEWAVGNAAMSRLDGVVPYGISVGNNDMDEPAGDVSRFCEVFPAKRYTDQPWYGGQYRNNADSAQLFEVDGRLFLILHLECNAPDDVLDWANGLMTEYADRHIIVTAHMFLGPVEKPKHKQGFFTDPRGVAQWSKCHGQAGNSPQQMWDKCLSRHRSLFLILCGDQSRVQAMRMQLTGRQGNRVDVCLCDYYGAAEGWLRLYRFVPAEHRLDGITYGAVSGTPCEGTQLVPDREQHQFAIDLPF